MARSGTRLVVQARNGSTDSCETFYFAGANTYYLVRTTTWAISLNLGVLYRRPETHSMTHRRC